MAAPELLRLVPDAPAALGDILDPSRGPLERPNRSEIFGPERFAQHGVSLGETHAARFAPKGSTAFFPRLRDNIRILREAHHYIGWQAKTGYDVSPAAEWLLDNFHLIEAQLREITDGLPRRYFRDLPVLQDEPLVGLPRIYGVAWAFVAHTDSAFNEELLVHFLKAYETTRELTLGELWALPTTLRVVLIENLRRLAERVAANKAAREVANLCCDGITACPPARLDAVLALLNRRGVGEPFLAQTAQRLQDHRSEAETAALEWLHRKAPHLAEVQTRLPAAQAADNLSVGNAITSLRSIGDADWPGIVASASVLTQLMLASPAFAAERDDTRDDTLHGIERLSKRSGRSERVVAETLLGFMHPVADTTHGDESTAVAGYWLRGPGQVQLLPALGLPGKDERRRRRLLRRIALPLYLASLAVATAGIVAWLLLHYSIALPGASTVPWWTLLAGALFVLPASEMAVAVINRLISESSRPSRLPRLALLAGIPDEHRTMVVIPAMLTKPGSRAPSSRTNCNCTTSPIRRTACNSRCSPTGPTRPLSTCPTTRSCSARHAARSNASTRSTRSMTGDRRASSSCIASGVLPSRSSAGSAGNASAASWNNCWACSPRARRARFSTWVPSRGSPPTCATCSPSTATRACHLDGCAIWSASPRIRTTSRAWPSTGRA